MLIGVAVIIVAGILVINFLKSRNTGTTLPTGEVSEQKEGPTIIRDGKTYHVVQSGENLWKIAETYFESGYNWVDIAKANNISESGFIEANQELLIPSVEPRKLTVVAEPTSNTEIATKDATAISESSYTVVKGDDLWHIAVRAYGEGYKWSEIAKANKLVNPNLIHPGNVLTIPR